MIEGFPNCARRSLLNIIGYIPLKCHKYLLYGVINYIN